MHNRGKKLTVAALLAGLTLAAPTYFIARADEPVAQASAKRDPKTIGADIDAQGAMLGKIIDSPTVLSVREKRDAAAPKVIPILKKMLALYDELAAAEPKAKEAVAGPKMEFNAMLAAMGDQDTIKSLEKQSASATAEEAESAKVSQLMARWWQAGNSAADQAKVLDDLSAQAKANPSSEGVAQLAFMFTQSAANKDLAARAGDVILKDLKGDLAKEAGQAIEVERKLRSLEDKPLTLAGKTIDGHDLSTDSYKGKVVLVDFWATWCGPCKAELPRVKQLYKDYHDKGLEVLGISLDEKEQDLKTYLKDNPEMAWPQILDSDKPGQPGMASRYGIESIPRMLLIDKKGVVRTINARTNMEDLIPKMLAE